jgi:hypothetical protein
MDVANSVPELKSPFENQCTSNTSYNVDLYFESFIKEEWMISMQKRQKMREDLSTAIDDHMSVTMPAAFTYSSILRKTENLQKGIEIEPVDNKQRRLLPTRCILPTLRYFFAMVSIQLWWNTGLQTLVVPVLIFVKPTLCFLLACLAGIQLLKTHFGATSTDGILIKAGFPNVLTNNTKPKSK